MNTIYTKRKYSVRELYKMGIDPIYLQPSMVKRAMKRSTPQTVKLFRIRKSAFDM